MGSLTWSGCGGEGASAPVNALLDADAGAFAALCDQDVGVAGVLVAPARRGVQLACLDGPVGVVGVEFLGEQPCRPVRWHRPLRETLTVRLPVGLAHLVRTACHFTSQPAVEALIQRQAVWGDSSRATDDPDAIRCAPLRPTARRLPNGLDCAPR